MILRARYASYVRDRSLTKLIEGSAYSRSSGDMAATVLDRSWMLHPSFSETQIGTAGLFVHFGKVLQLDQVTENLPIQITADTRSKYVNKSLVALGLVYGNVSQ